MVARLPCRRTADRKSICLSFGGLWVWVAGALQSIVQRLFLIELGPAVKERAAGPFLTVIGTLDAIHLASAILWQQADPEMELAILTADRQLALCARSLGLRVA